MIIQPKDSFRPGDGVTHVPSIEGPLVVEQRGTWMRVIRISDVFICHMNERRIIRFAADLAVLTGHSVEVILLNLRMVQSQNTWLKTLTPVQIERFPFSEIAMYTNAAIEWWWNVDSGEFYYQTEYSYSCDTNLIPVNVRSFFLATQPHYSEEHMNNVSADWGWQNWDFHFAQWCVAEYYRIMGQ